MTEETIKNTLTETRKQVLSAEYHYEIAAKQLLEQHEAEMVDRLFKVGIELRDKRHEIIQTLRSSVVNWNDIVEIFDRHGIDLVDKVEF